MPDEETGPLERVLAVADSGNGLSSELDVAQWHFINPELTVHLHREAVGEWVCLDAQTAISAGGAGLATSVLSDAQGGLGVGARRCWSAAGRQCRPQPGLLVHNRVPVPPAGDQPGVDTTPPGARTPCWAARPCRRARVWVEAGSASDSSSVARVRPSSRASASDCRVRAGCHSSAMPRAG